MQYEAIRYVKRNEIDDRKWNDCIQHAANSLLYATSFYLDHLSKRWDGLILGDYEAVMPITWNQKWGVTYLYQPPFIQQCGIFAGQWPTQPLIRLFIDEVKRRFLFAEIALNYANPDNGFMKKANFVLSLNNNYSTIAEAYKTDLKNNLRKAAQHSLNYCRCYNPAAALELFHKLYSGKMSVTQAQFHNFGKLCAYAQQHGLLIVREIRKGEKLVASAVLFNYNNRLYLLQDALAPEGRSMSANHFLIDQLIREFAGRDMIFDFEGSSIPGIAHFYQNFGAIDQPFYFFYHNRLPWPLSVYKRNRYFHAPSRASQP